MTDHSDINHEAEFVDEDRFTSVIVEAMDVSKEGLYHADQMAKGNSNTENAGVHEEAGNDIRSDSKPSGGKRKWSKDKPKPGGKSDQTKKKRKKFRYESKAERKVTRVKERIHNSKQARARRAG